MENIASFQIRNEHASVFKVIVALFRYYHVFLLTNDIRIELMMGNIYISVKAIIPIMIYQNELLPINKQLWRCATLSSNWYLHIYLVGV